MSEPQTNQQTESKILRQVKALLKVTSARGATEEEAQNAAAKAQELLLRYNLTLSHVIDLETASDPVEGRIVETACSSSLCGWKASLLAVTAKAYNCRSLTTWKGGKRAYQITGRVSSVAVAAEMFHYLTDAVETVAQFRCRGQGKSYSDSFKKGMVARLGERLQQQKETLKRTEGQSFALAVVSLEQRTSQEVANYYQQQGMRISTGRGYGSRHSSGYRAGREAGEKVSLAPQVSGSKGFKALGGS